MQIIEMQLEFFACLWIIQVLSCCATTPCNVTVSGRLLPIDSACPSACPYWGQVLDSTDLASVAACRFKCVEATMCGNASFGLDVRADVADSKLNTCRSCQMMGCMRCKSTAADKCELCDKDYTLKGGYCTWNGSLPYAIGVGVVFLLFMFLGAWYVDLLCCRRAVNKEGLKHGLDFRQQAKLTSMFTSESQPLYRGHRGHPYPLCTNLTKEQIAGSGFVLHMRYQIMWLAWAAALAAIWLVICTATEPKLLWLGWWTATTPRELCHVVTRNSGLDSDKNWVRVLFISIAYTFTTLFSFATAVHANNNFKKLDVQVTMGDYMAVCRGLPSVEGTEPVEEELKLLFTKETGKECIGVSVCWSYFDQSNDVWELSEKRLVLTEIERKTFHDFQSAAPLAERDNLRWKIFGRLDRLLGHWVLFAPIERVPLVTNKVANSAALNDQAYGRFNQIGTENQEQLPVRKHKSDSTPVPDSSNQLPPIDSTKSLEAAKIGNQKASPRSTRSDKSSSLKPLAPQSKAKPGTSMPRPKSKMKAKRKPKKSGEGEESIRFSGSSNEPAMSPRTTDPAEDTDSPSAGASPGASLTPSSAPFAPGIAADTTSCARESIKLINSLKTSKFCFVVFNTESERDEAVEAVSERGGLQYRGGTLTLSIEESEPEGVNFSGFGLGRRRRRKRFIYACLFITAGLCFWLFCFYLPYAGFIASYDYDSGQKPGGLTYYGFVCIIVAANLSMYCTCAICMALVGFTRMSDKENWYLVTYCATVCVNVICDIFVTYYVSYSMMKAAGASNKDGVLVSNLQSHAAVFESYPMQRTMGYQMFLYCFPGTFFLPFVGEGIGAITLPWHLQQLILVSRADLIGRWAERTMTIFLPMDMGRYADIAINIILAAIMFYFPMGFFLPTLLALVFSHIYIYAYDHYRTLRCTEGFNLGSYKIERTAQALMALPCGVMLSALIYKTNCTDAACLNQDVIGLLSGLAFVGHVVVHVAFVYFVVPHVSIGKVEYPQKPYAEVAESTPCTWFSANPIYCLRSRDFYKHDPPCSYFVEGKEDNMWPAPAVGQHFNPRPVATE